MRTRLHRSHAARAHALVAAPLSALALVAGCALPDADPDQQTSDLALQTAEFQTEGAGRADYVGTRDTTLVQVDPNGEHGDDPSCLVDGDYPTSSGHDALALLRWDISSVPAGATVRDASITLHVTNGTRGTYKVYALTRTWYEPQANWTHATDNTPWAQPGARGEGDRDWTVLGMASPGTAGTYTITLNRDGVAAVQRWVEHPAQNFGVVIGDAMTADSLRFDSSEAPDHAARPRLTVRYSAPAPRDGGVMHDAGGGGGGPRVSPTLVPAHGAWLGSTASRMDTIEREIGRRYDIVHTYHGWREQFPTAAEEQWSREGRFLLLDWDAADSGARVAWRAIASGAQDAVIDAAAARLRAFGQPVFLNFNHEPEADVGADHNGSAADFVDAWRHVYQRFARAGASNVVFAWIVMGFNENSFPALYPGDAYVDWIGWDPYNWYGCHPEQHGQHWRTFADIVQPFYDWATTNHPSRPLMLGEYGTNENAPGAHPTKGEWFTQSLADLQHRFPALRATVYFNQGHESGFCDRWVDTSAESLRAYSAMAHDPYYNQPHR